LSPELILDEARLCRNDPFLHFWYERLYNSYLLSPFLCPVPRVRNTSRLTPFWYFTTTLQTLRILLLRFSVSFSSGWSYASYLSSCTASSVQKSTSFCLLQTKSILNCSLVSSLIYPILYYHIIQYSPLHDLLIFLWGCSERKLGMAFDYFRNSSHLPSQNPPSNYPLGSVHLISAIPQYILPRLECNIWFLRLSGCHSFFRLHPMKLKCIAVSNKF
jgi:hypothetical protein